MSSMTDNLRAEVERLREIIDKSDSARWLEAVQRACDERLTALKHEARDWQSRAELAERQLAEARAALAGIANFVSTDNGRFGALQRLAEIRNRACAALQDRAPSGAEGER